MEEYMYGCIVLKKIGMYFRLKIFYGCICVYIFGFY